MTNNLIKQKNIFLVLYVAFAAIITLFLALKGQIVLAIGILLGIPALLFLIKKPVRLVYAQLFYVLTIKILISDFGIPSIANYVTDIFMLLIGLCAIMKYIKEKPKLHIKGPILCVLFLFLSSVLGLIMNGQSMLLYVWGFRNIYRFFIFFFGCAVLLEKEDIAKIFKILYVYLFINVILSTYQYFIQKLGQDYIGGSFGTLKGCNAYMNIYLVILFAYYFVMFQNKKASLRKFLLVLVMSLYIAAISELKIFYLEIIVIIILSFILAKPNKRTIILVILSLIGVYIAINLLYMIYPGFKDFFTLDGMLNYSNGGGYSNEDNINRTTALGSITDLFLDSPSKVLFGIGMGSAEVSQFSAFNSDFYIRYQYLAYDWFSHAFMLLENGYVGFILYTLFFIAIFLGTVKINRRTHNTNRPIYMVIEILACICILLMWYNSSLRMESAYLLYIVLTIPFVLYKDFDKNTKKLTDNIVEVNKERTNL